MSDIAIVPIPGARTPHRAIGIAQIQQLAMLRASVLVAFHRPAALDGLIGSIETAANSPKGKRDLRSSSWREAGACGNIVRHVL
jgi:hypothetical protein